MRPERVKPYKFHKHTIIYDDGDFAVAYGIWEGRDERLAMRWNGYGDDIGYPSQGGNPLWFQLPNTGIWTSAMLEALAKIEGFKKIDEFKGMIK
ncbi:hypothetical protein FLLO111716_13635 [Flavobacterium longum]|uniref:hypothetical protein n=1 Tax=Flavobacterium longum TaxID=1299340 RepID=UPI0039ECC70F